MFEEIELESIPVQRNSKIENGIQTTTPQQRKSDKPFDFFTQYDVKNHKKSNTKKTGQIRNVDSNLMDIINSELAKTQIAIANNVINKIDNFEQTNHLLNGTKSKILSVFNGNKGWNSWFQNNGSPTLCPEFPQVTENNASKSTSIPIEYIEPIKMDDLLRRHFVKKSSKPRFLDLLIYSVQFKHHPKLSLEQLLANKLDETFHKYQDLKQNMDNIMKEIKINRETKNNLIKELKSIIAKKEKLKFDLTIRKYTGKMLELKHKYNENMKQEKDLLNDIISLWSDIESVRHKFKTVKTPSKLNVTEKELNDDEFDILWNETNNTEFSDLLDELEYDYVTKYLAYKEEKQQLKNKGQNNLQKPHLLIDENEIKLETEKIVNSFLQKDKIKIELIKDESIVSYRNDSDNIDVQIRIYVDDIYVCETDNHLLEVELRKKTINESFAIQILPSNINLILTLRISDELSFVKFDLSDMKSSVDITEVSFDFNNSIPPTSKHVGSGYEIKNLASVNKVRLKSCYLFKEVISTKCLVKLKLNWNEKMEHNDDISIKSLFETELKLKKILNNVENTGLEEIIKAMENVYDKKITDDNTLESLANIVSNRNSKPRESIEFDDSSVDLVRIKLLYLRNKGDMNDINDKSIPIYGNQISTEHLDFLQKCQTNELSVENLTSEKYSNMDPIELQRYIGIKYIESLNKNIERTIHEHLFKRTSQDVVVDLQELSWRKYFSKQLNMSKLNSYHNNMTFYRDDNGNENEIHITVLKAYNLPERLSPIINDDEANNAEDNIAGFKMRSLRPFVRVHYKNNALQTSTAIGCHPTWNQTLTFSTTPENLPAIEINIFDEEKFNIADNYPDSDSYQSRTMHYRYLSKWIGSIHIPTKSLRHFGKLSGTFKINLPPIIFGYESLSNGKGSAQSLLPEVSRMLKKETSFLTLRITSKNHSRKPKSRLLLPTADDDYVIKHLNSFLLEYINDFPSRIINLTAIDSSGKNRCVTQFLQAIPPPGNEYLPRNLRIGSTKSSNLSKTSSSFSDERSPDKDVEKGIAEPEDSVYSVYEGRHLKDDLEKMMFTCMRYVSLIPTYEVKECYSVVLTGMELLKVICGTPFDHTVLLASYFIYLGIKTYIAVGTGFPHGPSAFVLTKYDLRKQKTIFFDDQSITKKSFLLKNDRFIWYVYDASCGERYELRDITCPLKTVDYIFDDENIWVNIQSTLDSESISFDLNKSADWKMVFNKNIYVIKQSPVNDVSIYTTPPSIEQLRESLENKIRLKVQKWRPHMKTIWNRYCSALLKEMLPQWEYWTFYPNEPKPGLSQKFKQLTITYKMHGFPLHLPYTKSKTIMSTLKSTVIHANEDPNVEFALAVEIYPYPKNVLSVWVFLASMSRI